MQKLPEKSRNITKKFLLNLPVRKWDKTKTYDTLFIVPTTKMHASGYRIQAIIGVINGYAEIAASCDDIGWTFPKQHPYGKGDPNYNRMRLRTDCYPNGIFRMWASSEHYFCGKFKVGPSLSSTDITLEIHPLGDGVNKMTGETIKVI